MGEFKATIDNCANKAAESVIREVITQEEQDYGIGLFINGECRFFIPLQQINGLNSEVGPNETLNFMANEVKKIFVNAIGQGIMEFWRLQVGQAVMDFSECLSDGSVK